MSKCFVCFVLLISIAEIAAAQGVSITRETFENAYTSSLEKAQGFSRYHKSMLVDYKDGNEEIKRSWIWQYQIPYRHRMIFEEKTLARSSRLERVSLEEKTFCKEDGGQWVLETGSCVTRLPWMITQMSYMMRANSPSRFTSEQTEKDAERITIFREFGKSGKKTPGKEEWPGFYESTFYVDSRGRFFRQFYKSGMIGSDKISVTWEDEVSYDPNIKIEAPIR